MTLWGFRAEWIYPIDECVADDELDGLPYFLRHTNK